MNSDTENNTNNNDNYNDNDDAYYCYYTHYVSSSGKCMSSVRYNKEYLKYWLEPIIGRKISKPKVRVLYPDTVKNKYNFQKPIHKLKRWERISFKINCNKTQLVCSHN